MRQQEDDSNESGQHARLTGERRGVELGIDEIEGLLRQNDGVADVAVTVDAGRGPDRLVAHIVPNHSAQCSAADLHEFLRREAIPYGAPSLVIFLNQLPLDSTGRIDRNALSFTAGERVAANCTSAVPRDLLECRMYDIWRSVLGLDDIGIHDDFLDYGGDSIQAGLISLRIMECFDVDLPVSMFFEGMTIAKAASEIYRMQSVSNGKSSDNPEVR